MLSSLANCVAIYTQGCQALLSLYIVTEFPLVLKEQILSLFDFEAHPLTWFLWNLQTTKIVQSDKSIYNEGFRYTYIYTRIYMHEKIVITYLKIVEGSVRNVIIKFFHHLPWTIANTNQNNGQRKFTAIFKKKKNQISKQSQETKLFLFHKCHILFFSLVRSISTIVLYISNHDQINILPSFHYNFNGFLFLWA